MKLVPNFIFCVLSLIISLDISASVPCSSSAYKAFDFWLGEWEVKDKAGVVQGNNKITKSADGCFIHENWTAVNKSKGYSINYYNPVTGLWSQKWVSAGSVIEYSGKPEQQGALSLEGMIYYQQNNISAKFRGTWTLLDDGRVRQFFQQYDDKTKEWNVWFEGYYTRKSITKDD